MNKVLAGQIGYLYPAAGGKLVVGRGDQHEAVIRHRHDGQPLAVFRKGNYSQLDSTAEDVANNAGGPRIFEVDLGGWEFGHELPNLLRQLMQADAVNRRDPYSAADLAN